MAPAPGKAATDECLAANRSLPTESVIHQGREPASQAQGGSSRGRCWEGARDSGPHLGQNSFLLLSVACWAILRVLQLIFSPEGWREFPAQLCRAFPQRGLETLGPISWQPVTRVFFTLPSQQADLSSLGMGLPTTGAGEEGGWGERKGKGEARRERVSGRGEQEEGSRQRRKASTHGEENRKERGSCCSSDLCLGALTSHCDASRKSATSASGPCPGQPALWGRHKCEMLPSPQRGLRLCGRVGLIITRSRSNLIQIKTLSSGSGKSGDRSDSIAHSGVSLGVCWASLCYGFPSVDWR